MWIGDGFGQYDALAFRKRSLKNAENALKRIEMKMEEVNELN